jgi:hypothetical protein
MTCRQCPCYFTVPVLPVCDMPLGTMILQARKAESLAGTMIPQARKAESLAGADAWGVEYRFLSVDAWIRVPILEGGEGGLVYISFCLKNG